MTETEWNGLRRAAMSRAFARMNDRQREAVFCTEGPLLILAGAGSGKTTVLIQRIVNMVRFGRGYSTDTPAGSEEDAALLRELAAGRAGMDERALALLAVEPCPSWKILAITFTNKAAGELKDRLKATLGEEGEEVTAGTFHSFCARILRRDGERLGYSSHFTIYDTDDSRRLMKECLRSLNIEEKVLPHKAVLAAISRAKDSLCSPQELAAQAGSDFKLKRVAEAYALYQRRLLEADAMDFDDLLSQTVRLLETCPEVLEKYQKRFRYVMVDEYQDTNHAQYRLVRLLAEKSGNLCVVGDDDQSIYKFRGATIENILRFEDEFSRCRVIRLEQNYRSTGRILQAANEVIAHNQNRKGKTLWTENPQGDKLQEVVTENEDDEARFIADTILDQVATGRHLRDFVSLYRMNAQSNALERALIKSGVPYRIIGGHRFFDTKEVRDAMAYLRVIQNPADGISLRRIINEPKRGIGDTTMENAQQIAEGLGISLYEVLAHAEDYPALVRSAGKLKAFTDMMDSLRGDYAEGSLTLQELYAELLDKSGYLAMWAAAGEAESERVENLKELASSLERFIEDNGEEARLSGFLEEAALMTDADNYDAGADAVVLMTMHAAKGLEFPVVFLPGMEEGVFPGMQTWYEPEQVEEERRLCYVALTRAREKLYLLRTHSRMLYGQTQHNRTSRFLEDIPSELLEVKDKTRGLSGFSMGGGFGTRSGGYAAKTAYRGETAASDTAKRVPITASRPSSRAAAPGNTFLQRQNGTASDAGTRETAPAVDWKVGDTVTHRTFGEGTVTAVTPMGNDSLLTIQFGTAGVKKLMANYAKLKEK